ncbi:MAG: aldose epimerase [Verrucomicrobiota bacterium]
MEVIDFQGHQIRKWTIGASTFLAYPEAGARLMNWHLHMADGSFRDVIHWPEDADLSNIAKVRGGNPILFPFAARTYCEGEIEFWKAQDGVKRPMKTHGYVRQGSFALESFHDKGFLAKFLPDDAARDAYPFDYEFTVRYRFEQLAFYVDLELRNHENKPIPWSAGHHFYFSLPWHDDSTRSDYMISTSAKKAFRHGSDGKLEPIKNFPEPASFGDPTINDLIRSKLKSGVVRFGPKGGEEDIKISIGDGSRPDPWTSVVSWTMADDSPFYCVEPWMGPPNSPEHGNGLHYVQPGKSEVFTVQVSLA